MTMQVRLDGFHNRTLPEWREVTSRVDVPATVVPASFDTRRARTTPAHVRPAHSIVERSSWRGTARKHALEHGATGVFRCDDSFVLFYREAGKVRQKTWAKVSIVRTIAAALLVLLTLASSAEARGGGHSYGSHGGSHASHGSRGHR